MSASREELKQRLEALYRRATTAERQLLEEKDLTKVLVEEVARLRESLRWYVSHDPMFGYLDGGIGTETPDGVQRLAARVLLAGKKDGG